MLLAQEERREKGREGREDEQKGEGEKGEVGEVVPISSSAMFLNRLESLPPPVLIFFVTSDPVQNIIALHGF